MKDNVDIEQLHNHLAQTMDSCLAQRREHDFADYDRNFQKLLEWARKVSAKTGVPLENL